MAATALAFSVMAGSGGFVIARRVAEQLGFRYFDWEITSEAAQRAGVSPNDVIAAERVPGFVERMMRRLGAASTVGVDTSPVFTEPTPAQWSSAMQSLTSDDYRDVIQHVVLELAQAGDCVIVGHAAQHTLRDQPGVLRVLVHGKQQMRAERLAQEQDVSVEEAAARVRQSDKERGELLRRVYHFDWLDAAMYDLSISSDHLTDDAMCDIVLAAASGMR